MTQDIDASEVTVEVKEARVTLEGTVPERWMKHTIEDIADGCHGVQDVENRIRVQSQSGGAESSGQGSTGSSTYGSTSSTATGRSKKE